VATGNERDYESGVHSESFAPLLGRGRVGCEEVPAVRSRQRISSAEVLGAYIYQLISLAAGMTDYLCKMCDGANGLKQFSTRNSRQ
jgi:hypothetical protein